MLGQFWRTGWDAHPERIALLVGLAAGYAYGIGRYGRGRPRTASHVAWFTSGIVLLYLTVASPLHHLADNYLFSLHMVQHQLLTLVVPPLLLLGTPGWMVRPVLDRPSIRAFGGSTYYPVVAFLVFNFFFSIIHAPVIYDGLFGNELLHFLTHAALLAAGLFTWLPLASPVPDILRRLPLPGQMLYCVAQTVPGSLIGSLIALSERVVYRHYGTAPLQLGVDPLRDQALGGLLMWVVGGTFFLGLLTVIFFVWADREERRAFG
jgi:putative membrane protein